MMDDRLGIGGNAPPLIDPEKLAEAERLTKEALALAKAQREAGPIKDAQRASLVSDVVAALRAAFKAVDAIRVEQKKPHDDAADAVQKAFKVFLNALESDANAIKTMAAQWLAEEQKRQAEEKARREAEARRQQDEAWAAKQLAEAKGDTLAVAQAEEKAKAAEAAEAAAQKVQKAKMESASGGGRTMALRTQAYAQINNWRAVFMHFENEPDVREILQRLADREIRAGLTVPGATRAERHTAA